MPEYQASDYRQYFNTLNKILALSPSLPQDAAILQEMKEIGVGPGLSEQLLQAIPSDELETACKEALKEIEQKGMEFGEDVHFWRIARTGIGNYGSDYMQRAVVWHKGALANQPKESLYPSTFQDSTGQLLDGNHDYYLHFAKDEIPPVSQFWSLTMYLFRNALLVENPIHRYSIGDRTKGLQFDEDGGLTICIQHEEPSNQKDLANWLPAPKEKFYMTLRLYGPSEAAIRGEWQPPAVQRKSK